MIWRYDVRREEGASRLRAKAWKANEIRRGKRGDPGREKAVACLKPQACLRQIWTDCFDPPPIQPTYLTPNKQPYFLLLLCCCCWLLWHLYNPATLPQPSTPQAPKKSPSHFSKRILVSKGNLDIGVGPVRRRRRGWGHTAKYQQNIQKKLMRRG